MLPNLIFELLHLQKMLAKLLYCNARTFKWPPVVPNTLLTLRLPHNSPGEHPVISRFMAVQGYRPLVGPARDAEQVRTAQVASQSSHLHDSQTQGGDNTWKQHHVKTHWTTIPPQNDSLSSFFPLQKGMAPTHLSQYLLQGQGYAKPDISVSGLFFKTTTSGMR